MVTPDLIDYIRKELKKNTSKEAITAKLALSGWYTSDIEEGFARIEPPKTENAAPSASLLLGSIPTYTYIVPKEETVVEAPSVTVQPLELSRPITTPVSTTPTTVVPPSFIPIKPEPVVMTPKINPAPTLAPTPASAPVSIPAPTVSSPSTMTPPVKATTMSMSNMATLAKEVPKEAVVAPSAQPVSASTPIKPKRSLLKWVIVFLVVCALSVVGYAALTGRIKVLNSLIKTDPKILILKMPETLAMLPAYKVDTDITLSSPLFSSITSGLVSGEPITSRTEDSISTHISGFINQGVAPMYDYTATVKSSILKDPLSFDFKYDGKNSFVSIPSLTQLLGPNAPKAATISVGAGDFELLAPAFSPDVADIMKKFNLYKILSSSIPPFIGSEMSQALGSFIQNVGVLSKSDETVDGSLMYHYQLNASSELTQALASQISSVFLANLTPESKATIDESLHTVTLDSIDVWIGKADNNVYQYKVAATIPLSKVLGIDDKGLGDSRVKLLWQTRFHDLSVPNKIELPTDALTVPVFIKTMSDTKVKDVLDALKVSTQTFRNAVGNFGKASNTLGSCAKPTDRSLFSPTGQPKAAVTVVGDIATNINSVIALAGDSALCYSSPTAWAVSVPLVSDPASYYCVDDKGSSALTTKIAGPACK
jgi:hypothetical protein